MNNLKALNITPCHSNESCVLFLFYFNLFNYYYYYFLSFYILPTFSKSLKYFNVLDSKSTLKQIKKFIFLLIVTTFPSRNRRCTCFISSYSLIFGNANKSWKRKKCWIDDHPRHVRNQEVHNFQVLNIIGSIIIVLSFSKQTYIRIIFPLLISISKKLFT